MRTGTGLSHEHVNANTVLTCGACRLHGCAWQLCLQASAPASSAVHDKDAEAAAEAAMRALLEEEEQAKVH